MKRKKECRSTQDEQNKEPGLEITVPKCVILS